MATLTLPKKFEKIFKSNWESYVPDSFCYRLNDQVTGYKGSSSNISDFICYKKPIQYIIDCKTHKGNTLGFSDFSQYEEMLRYINIPGMVLGTMIWFYEKDIVVFVPIQTWKQLSDEGAKSFNIKMICDGKHDSIVIPSTKKRTFMESNYLPFVEEMESREK